LLMGVWLTGFHWEREMGRSPQHRGR